MLRLCISLVCCMLLLACYAEDEVIVSDECKHIAKRMKRQSPGTSNCPSVCWLQWSDWGACSCGAHGTRTRTRPFNDRDVSCNSNDCLPFATEKQACHRACSNGGTTHSTGCFCTAGWTGPCCETAVSCGKPTTDQAAYFKGSYFPYDTTVDITCGYGYHLTGDSTRYCDANGTWSGTTPSCEQIFCDNLPDPAHGKALHHGSRGNKTHFGNFATFSCNRRYILQGNNSLQCGGSTPPGKFIGEPPTCKKCGDNLAGPWGWLHSPNYPNSYPNNKICEWKIVANKETQVHLIFVEFTLGSSTCQYENVTVYDGTEENSNIIGTYCENKPSESIQSSGNSMKIVLISRDIDGQRGFKAIYISSPVPAAEAAEAAEATTVTVKVPGSVRKTTQHLAIILGVFLGIAVLIIMGLLIYILLKKNSQNSTEMSDHFVTALSVGKKNNMDKSPIMKYSAGNDASEEMEIVDNLCYDSLEVSRGTHAQDKIEKSGTSNRPRAGDVHGEVQKREPEQAYANV